MKWEGVRIEEYGKEGPKQGWLRRVMVRGGNGLGRVWEGVDLAMMVVAGSYPPFLYGGYIKWSVYI